MKKTFAVAAMISIGLGQLSFAARTCDVAGDLDNFALQRAMEYPDVTGLQQSLGLLKEAIYACPSSGDFWYRRSLLENRLGNQAASRFSLSQAQRIGSSELTEGIDPFRLASTRPIAEPPKEKWALILNLGTGFLNKTASDLRTTLIDSTIGNFSADHVFMLEGPSATKSAVEARLSTLARRIHASDLLFLYVSAPFISHRVSGFKNAEVQYLLSGSELISLIGFAEFVRSEVVASRTVLIFDNKRLDTPVDSDDQILKRAVGPSTALLKTIAAGVGRAVMSSSEDDQVVVLDRESQQTIFGLALIRALTVTHAKAPMSQVFGMVQREVNEHALLGANVRQTPLFFSSDGGPAIVLGLDAKQDDGIRTSAFNPSPALSPPNLERDASTAFTKIESERLIAESNALHQRTDIVKAELRRVRPSRLADVRTILLPKLQVSIRELNEVEQSFLGIAADQALSEDATDRDKALKIAIDDLRITYANAARSLGSNALGELTVPFHFEKVLHHQIEPSVFDPRMSSLTAAGLRPMEDNEALYAKLVATGSPTFDLTVLSAPEGASIEYKRRGDEFKRYSGNTMAIIQSLPIAIWAIRLEKEGYDSVDVEYDPFRNRESSVSAELKQHGR